MLNNSKNYYARFTLLSLALILVLGSVLRLIGIRFGLPMAYHNDEWVLVLATRQFFSGDFNPHNFLYPSFLMYIMHLLQRLYFLVFPGQGDLSTLNIICRITVVFFGVASLWATYQLGRKLVDYRVGLVAAFFLMLSPLHVVNSHFATTDVPLTFFIIVTLWATLHLLEKRTTAGYVIVGILFGFTVSIKIPGAVVFLAILTAHLYGVAKDHNLSWVSVLKRSWRDYRRMLLTAGLGIIVAIPVYLILHNFEFVAQQILSLVRIDVWIQYLEEIVSHVSAMAPKLAVLVFVTVLLLGCTIKLWWREFNKMLLLLAVALLAFMITTPYAILDYKAFAHDFFFQMVISQSSWSGMFAGKAPGYITNMNYLHDNFGIILLLSAGAGLVLSLIRARISYFVIMVFALVYYLYIGSWRLMFSRYMVPMLPVLAIWAGFTLIETLDWLREKIKHPSARMAAVSLALAVLLVFPGAGMLKKSHNFNVYLLKPNTKKIAYDWAVTHLPKDARILREQYTPELELAGYQVRNVHFTFEDSVTVDYVRRYQCDYIIVSDKLWKRPVQKDGILSERKAYGEIERYADIIYHIKPTPQKPGPEIKIFKVRTDSLMAVRPPQTEIEQ